MSTTIQSEITRISDSVTAQATTIEEIKSKLSTGLGYEDTPFEWAMLFSALDDGTYATKYSVGDLIPLDLGDEGAINMQIVAFDADELADGSGKAKVSLISKELLNTNHRMNPALEGDATNGYTEGTGTIGGWEKCELRSYLEESILPLISPVIFSRIATVTKTQDAHTTANKSVTQTTQDDLWVPSVDELYDSSGLYYSAFPNNDSRIKRESSSASAANWWLRSVMGITGCFECVGSNGSWSFNTAADSLGVVLGFCLS